MIITNKHHLPLPLVAAVSQPFFWTPERMGITTLIGPPRAYQLRIRHDEEIKEDAADRIWLLLGKHVHGTLENTGKKLLDGLWGKTTEKMKEILTGMLVEKKYTIEVGGWTIVCVGDVYIEALQELDDYKITSVWGVIDRKPKDEWVEQLNCNAYIYRKHGHEVKALNVIAILRDWSINNAKQKGNYPQAAVRKVKIPLWGDGTIRTFIEDRVMAHQLAEKLADDDLPFCTPQERFAQPDKWAVKKKTNKKAKKLFFREEEAQNYMEDKGLYGDHIIEFRPGKSTRCEDYCSARDFCNQWKLIKERS